ncbi:MAG: PAS domain S-box protein [Polyangiaceae bacterium]
MSRADRYRDLFEHLPIGIYQVTPAGVFLDANPTLVSILGYSSWEEMREVNAASLCIDPRERLRWRETLEREGHLTHFETRKRRKDGATIWLREHARVVKNAHGEIKYFEGAVVDVTQQRQVEASLVQAERLASVGYLAAGVAHEINNPLSYLTTNVEFASRVLTQCETLFAGADAEMAEAVGEARAALNETLEGIARVAQVVSDLKTFARPDESGAKTTDPKSAVDTAVAIVQNEIRHRARLSRELAPCANVGIGSQRLVQVLVNLLLFAAHSIPEGYTESHDVVVRLRHASSKLIEISVSDTGAGYEPDALQHLFEPFGPAPTSSGIGLGLAVCHSIVTHAGGSLTVESELDRGTTFRLLLPVADAAVKSLPARTTGEPRVAKRSRILVIDDEPLIGRALKRNLRGDHEVTVARDAREALRLLLQGLSFDLILCDVMMPGMSGVDFHLALSQYRPELVERVVFITGGAFTPRAEQFLESVPNRRLTKPIAEETLRQLIGELVVPVATAS